MTPHLDNLSESKPENKRRKYVSREKYTKEVLQIAVDEALTMADVLRSLRMLPMGNSHAYISKKIRDFGIDTSHFLKRSQFNSLRKKTNKIPAEEVLILSEPHTKKVAGYRLRKALIEIGREYICEECEQGTVWNDKPLTIQVDHKNGKYWDNRPSNLRFLCPNCHTQTENFCAKNKSIKAELRTCRECFNKVSSRAIRCRECFYRLRTKRTKGVPKLEQRKTVRPTPAVLRELIRTMPLTKIGRHFGVSDNAVRKWAIFYGMVIEKKVSKYPKPKGQKFIRAIVDGKVWCNVHKDMIPIGEFTKDKNDRLGLFGCCRECRKTQKGRSSKVTERGQDGNATAC